MAKCLLVLLNSPITLTLLRWGLERFPTLSTLSLHPYGKTVSSFFFYPFCLRNRVLSDGLLVQWYFFSRILTFID